MIRPLSFGAFDRPAPLDGEPAAWLFRDCDPDAQTCASRGSILEEDLRDAARARADRGGPRLLRRRVLRALLARALDRHPASLRFEREAGGAVRLAGAPGVHLSTAGRSGWSAVALGLRPLAVDVEANEALPRDALRRWLVHEASAKLTGRGLEGSAGLSSATSGLHAAFLVAADVTACLVTTPNPIHRT